MRLFKKSGSHELEPAWSYGTNGMIWQIYPAAGGILLGEERRIEEKKTFFFSLDRENGHELWQHASPGDEWWIGIEAVYRDTAFFHGFATPNLPLHRGIIAADVPTGKKLWENQELEFIGTRDDRVIGSRKTATGQSLVELDRRTGTSRGELSAEEVRSLGVSRSGSDVEVTFPSPIGQLPADDPRGYTVVKSHLDSDALAGSVEIVEQGRFFVFACYKTTGDGGAQEKLYSSVIKVVERNTGTVAYSDIVSTGVKALIPELFFVQHDMLYYIKERRTLVAVRLAP